MVANLPVSVYARTLSRIALTPASLSTLASSDPSVVSVSGMTAAAVSGGSATLTAKYSDKIATATFNVEAETGSATGFT